MWNLIFRLDRNGKRCTFYPKLWLSHYQNGKMHNFWWLDIKLSNNISKKLLIFVHCGVRIYWNSPEILSNSTTVSILMTRDYPQKTKTKKNFPTDIYSVLIHVNRVLKNSNFRLEKCNAPSVSVKYVVVRKSISYAFVFQESRITNVLLSIIDWRKFYNFLPKNSCCNLY